MKFNQWTLGLAAVGIVSLATVAQAEEKSVNSAFAGLTMSGAVETSASINTARNGALPGRSFDGVDRQDGFNFNSARLTLEKAVSEDQFGAGFRTDLVYGPDADAFYGGNVPIKQAYVALRVPVGNGIDIKMGVFDTPIGYEQFDSGSNPNFSRSYGFAIEPNHHTGVLASYKIVDALSISVGAANTHNGFGQPDTAFNDRLTPTEGRLTYLATATITLPEGAGALKGSTINLGIINGEDRLNEIPTLTQPRREGSRTFTSYYAGATINTGITGLTFGAAFDYRKDDDGTDRTGAWRQVNVPATTTTAATTAIVPVPVSTAAGAPQAFVDLDQSVWAVAGYVSYAATEKLKLHARYDVTQDDFAPDLVTVRIPPIPNNGVAKSEQHLQSLTLTAQYDIWANVLTRLEGRWDHGSGDSRNVFGANRTSNDAFTIAADVIYKF